MRRAYRILVQQLHPDVNPDPSAHELIKEVNEAYDVLGDAEKKRDYDYRLENPFVAALTPEEPVHRDPAYRRPAASRSYVHVNRGPTQRDLMLRYAPFVLKVFQAGTVLTFLLLLDFNLPHQVTDETISSFSNTGRSRYEANYLITQTGQRIKISARDGYLFEVDQPIKIVKSRILSILIEIQIPETQAFITNFSTIYTNFKFVAWLLGIFSIVGLAAKGKVEFRFNLGIMTFFVLIFTVFLLIK